MTQGKVLQLPEVVSNNLQTIGRTPLVHLKKLSSRVPAEIYAKLEWFNPGGSVKDRMALAIINEAERQGRLKPGGTIVEATSGNTGVALALIGRQRGYRVILVSPERISKEKAAIARAYGAEVIIANGEAPPDAPDSVYSVARRLHEEIPGSYEPDQHRNPMNPMAHYQSTGPEIWEQMAHHVDAAVIGIGTGGTVMGTGRYLKEQNPDLFLVGVDVGGSMLSEQSRNEKHLIEGLGIEFETPIFDPSLLDEILFVSNQDAIAALHTLAEEEAILAGGSSGAAVFACLEIAKRLPAGSRIVTIFPDAGERYLSKYFNPQWLEENNLKVPKFLTGGESLIEQQKVLQVRAE